jgi:hypothetical protein
VVARHGTTRKPHPESAQASAGPWKSEPRLRPLRFRPLLPGVQSSFLENPRQMIIDSLSLNGTYYHHMSRHNHLSKLYATSRPRRCHNARMLGLAQPCMRKQGGTDEEDGRRAVSELTQAMHSSQRIRLPLTKRHDALTQQNFIDKPWRNSWSASPSTAVILLEKFPFSRIIQSYRAILRNETHLRVSIALFVICSPKTGPRHL